MNLWPHQSRTISTLRSAVTAGQRRILVVGPTGSGKGTLATEILRLSVQRGHRGVFAVNRREIIRDIAARLRSVGVRTGCILPGEPLDSEAPVQVCSIQTLASRDYTPPGDVISIDEAHHGEAKTWKELLARYHDKTLLGFSATPSRRDGRPLSQFEHLIVAATYSELLSAGLICPVRTFQPAKQTGSDLACDPVSAYQQYAPGSKGFCFVASIPLGEDVALRFNEAGIPAKLVTGKTPKAVRDQAVEDLRAGRLCMLVNYNVFTEGVDIADAATCILAGQMSHVAAYLQRCGRVMRAHRSKSVATVLDLVGASLDFGLCGQDREYSLTGKSGYALTPLPALRTCQRCGLTQLSGPASCEGCGYEFPKAVRPKPRIFSEELRLVFDFENTPLAAKQVEYHRLLDQSTIRGYSLDWVLASYKATFDEAVPLEWLQQLPVERKRREFQIWRQYGTDRNYKAGYGAARYIAVFGSPPPR